MRYQTSAALMLCLASLATPAGAAGDPFVSALTDAQTAFEAQSFARMVDAARAAEAERPGHPRALYVLAVALAHDGQLDRAMKPLSRLAAMGLHRNIDEDARLAMLRDRPGFEELAARFRDNGEPIGTAVRGMTHDQRRFIPEGIAYDRDTNRYFLSSVYRREVVVPGEGGRFSAFIPSAAHGIYSAMGLFAEPNRRLLWIATAALPQMRGYDESLAGRSAVLAVDLDSGRISRRFDAPANAGPHAFGDITLGRRGEVFVSDGLGGRVYAVDRISGRFTPLGEAGQLRSPQGLAQGRDRSKLYIADYSRGLFVHDAESGKLSRLAVPENICVYGIDGLARYRDDLIAVQNGIKPARVVRIRLDESRQAVSSLEVLAANDPDFEEPTQGVVNGRNFYVVANSLWNRLGDDNNIPPSSELQRPRIVRIPLD